MPLKQSYWHKSQISFPLHHWLANLTAPEAQVTDKNTQTENLDRATRSNVRWLQIILLAAQHYALICQVHCWKNRALVYWCWYATSSGRRNGFMLSGETGQRLVVSWTTGTHLTVFLRRLIPSDDKTWIKSYIMGSKKLFMLQEYYQMTFISNSGRQQTQTQHYTICS